jgi:peptidoglycan hydrolase CwlO-like protein
MLNDKSAESLKSIEKLKFSINNNFEKINQKEFEVKTLSTQIATSDERLKELSILCDTSFLF